ncbi:MAG: GAF domain-containing protein [Reichenbachiella sp.]
MKYNGKEIEFPAVMQVSFSKVIDALEKMANDADEHAATYANSLLEEVAKYPELKDGFEDFDLIKKYKDPIDKLCRSLFPEALLTNEIKGLTPPFYFEPFYTSTRFDNIIKDSGEAFTYKMKDVDEDTLYFYCCYFILGSHFGYPMYGGGALKVDIVNKQSITRTYKLGINADMSELIPTEKALDITREDFEYLIDNFGNIDIWKEKFPPNSWIMRGVNIVNLVDITIDQSMSAITSNLLRKNEDSFEQVRNGVRDLLNNSELELGILTLQQGKLSTVGKNEVTSILLNQNEKVDCKEKMCHQNVEQLLKKNEAIIVSDVEKFHTSSPGYISNRLKTLGFQCYILAPLIHEGELLGFMELATKNRYELNHVTLSRLEEVLPVLAMAHKRISIETQNRIEAIIQQECTTIHESVKWRFEQEAEKFMNKQINDEHPVFKDIRFDQLYPIYGQMDIKGSSAKRNEAVKKDLTKQIKEVKKVINSAFKLTKMPAYEELEFRLDSFSRELKSELSAGSEHKILSFFKTDVYPVLKQLGVQNNTELKKAVSEFQALLDPELNSIYEERKNYDTSVNLINHQLSTYLDIKQEEAQAMFPHYFERYKTDGIEYNMYIGQSITQDKKYDDIYLNNLRLWQLIVMCEMENEFQGLQKLLPIPIEVASLILVYNTPLSVHFRMDEKRFDVEGAYNARYEIIKKRVDKSHIKGTNERVTQPGKLAIIYSQDQDAKEYRGYLDFLSSRGYIKGEIEELALEDLSGVTGLKALRVEVAIAKGLTVDELIKEIESNTEN